MMQLIGAARNAAVLLLLCSSTVVSHVLATSKNATDDFDWSQVEALDYLNYTDCYDGYKCAKLLVPLDWLDLTNENQVSIAITKLPATVDVADPSFGGPILLNPGGPSGSGVGMVRRSGHKVQRIVDGKKHFEIISFDPRGVGYTEPNGHCFEDTRKLELFNAKMLAVGWVDESPYALRTKWAAYQAQGLLCASANVTGFTNGDNIRNFMSTPSVARDMIAIAEAEEDLREKLVRKNPFIGKGESQISISVKEKTLLQYWGFSYGTILGNTFVTLFPDRVGRVILDGVADAPDYYAAGWTTNLQDTEKVVASFYTNCFAGGSRCPLYRPSDFGPEDIKQRFESVLEDLRESPIPVAEDGEARLITYTDVRALMFSAVYRPYVEYPALATAVNELLYGNYTPMLSIMPSSGGTAMSDRNSTIPWPMNDYNFGGQVQPAIACGDGKDITNRTIEEYQEYVDMLKEQSPTAGGRWAEITLECVGWKIRAKWQFEGDFITGGDNATANPVLFIGNTGDPVTPLRNAKVASAKHEGSGLLTQDSNGHCSLLSTANACTAGHVKAYFNDGVLPEPGTVCPDECVPWMESPCEVDVDEFGMLNRPKFGLY